MTDKSWSGAVVAQLTHNQQVGGSSPPSATINNGSLTYWEYDISKSLQRFQTMTLEGGKKWLGSSVG